MNMLQKVWLRAGVQVGTRPRAKRLKVVLLEGVELCEVHDGLLINGDGQCYWNVRPHDFTTDGECIGTPLYRKAN